MGKVLVGEGADSAAYDMVSKALKVFSFHVKLSLDRLGLCKAQLHHFFQIGYRHIDTVRNLLGILLK